MAKCLGKLPNYWAVFDMFFCIQTTHFSRNFTFQMSQKWLQSTHMYAHIWLFPSSICLMHKVTRQNVSADRFSWHGATRLRWLKRGLAVPLCYERKKYLPWKIRSKACHRIFSPVSNSAKFEWRYSKNIHNLTNKRLAFAITSHDRNVFLS